MKLDEFQEWQEMRVTKEVMELIKSRIEEAKDNLLPMSNSREFDLFVKGMIQGFTEVLEIKFEQERETDEV